MSLWSASSIGKHVLLLGVLAVSVWLLTSTEANGQAVTSNVPAGSEAPGAQAPASSNEPSGGRDQVAAGTSTAKSKIYVYRESSFVGAAGSPLITVNGNFSAVLKGGHYAEIEAQPGTLIVGATISIQGMEPSPYFLALNRYAPPTLRWPNCTGDAKKPNCNWDTPSTLAEKKGCAAVNWAHVEILSPENSKICKNELGVTEAALANWADPNKKSKELLLGLLLPTAIGSGLIVDSMRGPKGDVSAWLQVCGPDPFPPRTEQEVEKVKAELKRGDSSDEWSRCTSEVVTASWLLAMHESVKIEAEPGMTYYVKWAGTGSGGKMSLVDDPTGAKNVRGLHPVKE